MEYLIGKVIDGYKIESVLGKGGMGVVYKAKDTTLDRDVALKIMDSNLARDENFLKRFQSEAKALAKLQNPHITTIFALRETQVGLFIVMEYVDGGTLSDRIEENGHIDAHSALPIFKQILDALQHAHQAGIVHRDIKPGNIMLTRSDAVKVTDFGLAKMQQQVSSVTMTLGTGGTLFYMSPEQVRGLSNVDARGDIYSLGMTLYETLAGTTPFSHYESDFDIRQAIVEGNIPSPDKLNPAVPKGIAKVVMKAVDKNPEKRYQSASDMWQDLENVKIPVMKTVGESVKPQKAPSGGAGSSAMRPVLFGVLGLAVIAILYVIFGMGGDTAALNITTIPAESTVIINGQNAGNSPVNGFEVPVGAVSVKATRNGYNAVDTVISMSAGSSASLILSLKAEGPLPEEPPVAEDTLAGRQTDIAGNVGERTASNNQTTTTRTASTTGTVVLAAYPSGTVRIDGRSYNTSAGDPVRKSLDAGKYTVTFNHPRYGSKSASLTLKAGQTRSLSCYFEQYVNINANPVWGTIVVNGRNTGEYTPKARYPLSPGNYRITVRREGYKTLEGEKSISVEPTFQEKVHTLVFTLEK